MDRDEFDRKFDDERERSEWGESTWAYGKTVSTKETIAFDWWFAWKVVGVVGLAFAAILMFLLIRVLPWLALIALGFYAVKELAG